MATVHRALIEELVALAQTILTVQAVTVQGLHIMRKPVSPHLITVLETIVPLVQAEVKDVLATETTNARVVNATMEDVKTEEVGITAGLVQIEG